MRPRWPSTGRGRAPTHLQGHSAAEDGRRRLSCLARNAGGEAVRQGKKAVDGRCGPGARGEAGQGPRQAELGGVASGGEAAPPSRLAHQEAETEAAGQNPRRMGRRKRPHGVHPQPGRQPPAPAPPQVHPGPPPPAPGRPRQALSTPPASGQTVRSRLPAWTGRRAKDGTRERAPLAQAFHRIIRRICDGRVEAVCIGCTTRWRRPTPRRLAARRGA